MLRPRSRCPRFLRRRTPTETTWPVRKLCKSFEGFQALKDLDALVEGNEDLKKQLNGAAVDAESLFDISLADDSVKLPVELQLKLANPDHFAALVHFVDGEATLIETEAKDELASLSLEEVGTYAVLSFVDAA